jgi:hypothetical protein
MAAPGPWIWWLGRGIHVFRLAPLLAAAINRRTGKFIREAWMVRLEAYLVFDVFYEAIMLGMGLAKIRNAWVDNLALLPYFLLASWTLCGLRPGSRLSRALTLAGGAILATATWEAFHGGLTSRWIIAMTLEGAVILLASLWEIGHLTIKDELTPFRDRPQFWLLSVWVLHHGMMLVFFPLSNFFLRTLSREWILYPWLLTFLLDALFNLILSKTFLCPKRRSS